MSRYVERDQDGTIKGSYARLQPGYAEEALQDNHPDLVAFDEKIAAIGLPVHDYRDAEIAGLKARLDKLEEAQQKVKT